MLSGARSVAVTRKEPWAGAGEFDLTPKSFDRDVRQPRQLVVGVRAGPAQQDHRLNGEDDLPDLCVRFHVAMSVDDVIQGKGPVDDGS